MKKAVDKGESFAGLLTGLAKAFDCLSHQDLTIAKVIVYGFSLFSTRLIHSSFSNHKQKTDINLAYNSLEEILFVILVGFILGLLLTSSLCGLFSVTTKILQTMQTIIRHK